MIPRVDKGSIAHILGAAAGMAAFIGLAGLNQYLGRRWFKRELSTGAAFALAIFVTLPVVWLIVTALAFIYTQLFYCILPMTGCPH